MDEAPNGDRSLMSSSEEYSSDEVEDGGAADFSGQLSTRVAWDVGAKQLHMHVKQDVENGRKVAFKWKVCDLGG